MYRRSTPGQLSFENFYLPFGGKLSGENRWVKLAQLIPWEEFEAQYAEQLSEGMGAPAKSFRMALGALIIKERLGTSDIETVEQIRENPYLQFVRHDTLNSILGSAKRTLGRRCLSEPIYLEPKGKGESSILVKR